MNREGEIEGVGIKEFKQAHSKGALILIRMQDGIQFSEYKLANRLEILFRNRSPRSHVSVKKRLNAEKVGIHPSIRLINCPYLFYGP
ncbi:hypothetical protein KEJ19_07150 [Candidatus Bathyarchaeota archaeon]|nr:hypothetical protein [Candidatus Bathyarchaeota archaeon]